jgi:hypothetical protein
MDTAQQLLQPAGATIPDPIAALHLAEQTRQAGTPRPTRRWVRTKRIAARFDVQPESVRTALWRNGHFMNLVPLKMPNGTLLWDDEEADRLLAAPSQAKSA